MEVISKVEQHRTHPMLLLYSISGGAVSTTPLLSKKKKLLK